MKKKKTHPMMLLEVLIGIAIFSSCSFYFFYLPLRQLKSQVEDLKCLVLQDQAQQDLIDFTADLHQNFHVQKIMESPVKSKTLLFEDNYKILFSKDWMPYQRKIFITKKEKKREDEKYILASLEFQYVYQGKPIIKQIKDIIINLKK